MTWQRDITFWVIVGFMLSGPTRRPWVTAQDEVTNSTNTSIWEDSLTSDNSSGVGNDTEIGEFPTKFWSGTRLGGYCCGNHLSGVCTFISSECVNCTCTCITGYTYVDGYIGRCEAEKSQESSSPAVEGDNKLPLEACTEKSQCIEGLDCLDGVCACPSPCEYLPEKLVCDCGPGDTPWWPIIIGFAIGFLIVSFWVRAIADMIDRHKKRRNNKVSQMTRSVSRISTLGAAYGTDHVTFQPLAKNYAHPPRQAVAPTSPLRPAFG
ncbi:uncharacterized protein LOC122253239 [Penaeus japonicus]|uniref:uncharacterized protein LOC122253239 n=1 Tax=Penaeus japonicus TaxID=27405 RepID=UPI001C715AF3|nr:uncharacterized protein LOC122253239 [Penaeus japonicus]